MRIEETKVLLEWISKPEVSYENQYCVGVEGANFESLTDKNF